MPKRSTVTILFCDIVGSTALLNQIGEDANDELRRDVFSVLRGPIATLGGQEVKTQGDGMMVAFEGRASDAIALALRTGSKVLVEPSILDEAAIVVSSEEDDEVERFKEFLDHVSAEDFDEQTGPGDIAPGESGPKPQG